MSRRRSDDIAARRGRVRARARAPVRDDGGTARCAVAERSAEGNVARAALREVTGTLTAAWCCMADMPDVLQILTAQHAEVDELLEKLEGGKGDRAALFGQLADELAAHAAVEEKIFYPAAMTPQTSDMLHESVEEHLEIKRLIADMLELDPRRDADTFDAKLSVLKENVSHHAHEEEEEKLFPKLRKILSAEDRAALGNEVLALFESLIDQSPRFQVPKETAEAAPLPSA
jgi:hypothetical protein